MRWPPRRAAARVLGLAASGIVLVEGATLLGVSGCVDGTTPDCSDAATRCGPDVDATIDHLDEAAIREASPPSDAPNGTPSTADAGRDGDAHLDAPAEG